MENAEETLRFVFLSQRIDVEVELELKRGTGTMKIKVGVQYNNSW